MKKNMTLGRTRCRPRRKEAKSGFLKTIDNNSVFKALYQACCKLQTLGKKSFFKSMHFVGIAKSAQCRCLSNCVPTPLPRITSEG